MRKLLGAIAALAGSAVLVSAALAAGHLSSPRSVQPSSSSAAARGPVRLGFWTGWQKLRLRTIPWRDLTELTMFSYTTMATPPYLNTAIHGVTPGGQRAFVRAVHVHHETALITIGGSDDQTWSTACASPNRATFVAAVLNEMQHYKYDGVDLDIEQGPFVGTADFYACVRKIHNALKSHRTAGRKVPLVTYDSDPTWEGAYMRRLVRYIDQFNLTDYNATCANQCAAVHADIIHLTSHGVPKRKLVEGIGMDPGMPHAIGSADCAEIAQYSATHHLAGVFFWTLQDEPVNNHGGSPCVQASVPGSQ